MKKANLSVSSVEELVIRFVNLALAQDRALLQDEISKFNVLFRQMHAVIDELRSRPGDGRHALLDLYEHPNLQVRLKAVKNSLALAPDEGRRVLQAIANSREYPQAMEAGMSLSNLDQGIFKPT